MFFRIYSYYDDCYIVCMKFAFDLYVISGFCILSNYSDWSGKFVMWVTDGSHVIMVDFACSVQ